MNIKIALVGVICLPFLLAIPPHVVVIVIDDLGNLLEFLKVYIQFMNASGWNDVLWNNAESFAKNLGELAK